LDNTTLNRYANQNIGKVDDWHGGWGNWFSDGTDLPLTGRGDDMMCSTAAAAMATFYLSTTGANQGHTVGCHQHDSLGLTPPDVGRTHWLYVEEDTASQTIEVGDFVLAPWTHPQLGGTGDHRARVAAVIMAPGGNITYRVTDVGPKTRWSKVWTGTKAPSNQTIQPAAGVRLYLKHKGAATSGCRAVAAALNALPGVAGIECEMTEVFGPDDTEEGTHMYVLTTRDCTDAWLGALNGGVGLGATTATTGQRRRRRSPNPSRPAAVDDDRRPAGQSAPASTSTPVPVTPRGEADYATATRRHGRGMNATELTMGRGRPGTDPPVSGRPSIKRRLRTRRATAHGSYGVCLGGCNEGCNGCCDWLGRCGCGCNTYCNQDCYCNAGAGIPAGSPNNPAYCRPCTAGQYVK